MNFRNLKIGQKLVLSFGVVLLISVATAILSYIRIDGLGDDIGLTNKDRYPKIVLAQNIKNNINEVARCLRNVLLMSNKADIDKEFGTIERDVANNTADLAKLDKMITSEKGRQNLKNLVQKREVFTKSRVQFNELFHSGKKDEAIAYLYTDLRPVQLAYMDAVDEVISFQEELMAASQSSAESQINGTHVQLLALGFAGLIAGTILAIVTTRRITIPLLEAVQIAAKVAEGDLTSMVKASGSDEIGQLIQALSNMNASLQKIVGKVRKGADSIANASGEIATGNMDLSGRTERQASSLEETASSMEELASTVKQNSDNARQAKHLATSASEVATRGGMVMTEVVDKMQAINESARKIVDIISVIDGIAFQTNILSLNAAVEAARAGEQGRGFAVVASEVRSLAQRSAAAAREIKALIGDSVEKVEAGSKLVGAAGTTMEEIVASVTRVTDIIAEISAAGDEQSAGIEQINRAVIEMDNVTQQNASLVEQAAAAAASMQEQASQLAGMVSVFKLDSTAAPVAPVKAIAAATPKPTSKVLPMVQRQMSKPMQRPAAQRLEATTGNRVTGGGWEEF